MMVGYAMHVQEKEYVRMFERMIFFGLVQSNITFFGPFQDEVGPLVTGKQDKFLDVLFMVIEKWSIVVGEFFN